ncbi:MAG: choloylglycine hydrolase [Gammaproteobacteria bacterium 28-57-27]|nr:MAG: choloylglycine hydrolase [Gammaproteobacteria bacterium 28-57-27]
MNRHRIFTTLAATMLSLGIISSAQACTRAVYHGENQLYMTGRSMDWRDPIPADMWIFPRGMKHNGGAGKNSVEWTSKYGSLLVTSFGIAASDGMNEKGLVANMLWLAASQYPDMRDQKNTLSISAWAQYFLDNFATVDEAVKAMQNAPLAIVSDTIPGTDRYTTLHLSISDATGDSAIFEYINGKLDIHHSRDFQVMTNDPSYDEQLAIQRYWAGIGGTTFLPGSNHSPDRFARAEFYINAIPNTSDTNLGAASVMSVMRNVSVPLGITTPGQPNISSTRWRVVADQKNLRYFYESTLTPNTFWVDLNKFDFSADKPVFKLALANQEIYSGEASKHFQPARPFEFLHAN